GGARHRAVDRCEATYGVVCQGPLALLAAGWVWKGMGRRVGRDDRRQLAIRVSEIASDARRNDSRRKIEIGMPGIHRGPRTAGARGAGDLLNASVAVVRISSDDPLFVRLRDRPVARVVRDGAIRPGA